MIRSIAEFLIFSAAIFGASKYLPGVLIENYITALWVALGLGIVNIFLKPILKILTFPINILTIGLFTLIINAFLVMMVAFFVTGFEIDSFGLAILFGIIISVIRYLVDKIFD